MSGSPVIPPPALVNTCVSAARVSSPPQGCSVPRRPRALSPMALRLRVSDIVSPSREQEKEEIFKWNECLDMQKALGTHSIPSMVPLTFQKPHLLYPAETAGQSSNSCRIYLRLWHRQALTEALVALCCLAVWMQTSSRATPPSIRGTAGAETLAPSQEPPRLLRIFQG